MSLLVWLRQRIIGMMPHSDLPLTPILCLLAIVVFAFYATVKTIAGWVL